MDKEMKNGILLRGENGGEKAETVQDAVASAASKVKFEVFGEEMIQKAVKLSGNSGRVYLPPTWVSHNVKIIRID